MKSTFIRPPIASALVLTVLFFAGPSRSNQVHDYSRIDAHALAATEQDEKSIPALAKYLSSGAQNDREKARAIFRWLTDRVAYDVQGYFAGRIPESSTEARGVLRTRKAVCQGYSDLFLQLGLRSGLEVVMIRGFAKGYSYTGVDTGSTNHVWNAVKVDGRWLLVDSTWGAGDVTNDQKFKKELEEYFFLTPPDHLICTHLPEDPVWQLLPTPISRDEFIRLARFKPGFFDLGLEPLSHRHGTIKTGATLAIQFACPPDVYILTGMTRGGKPVPPSLTQTVRTPEGLTVNIEFAEPGDYLLTISGRKGREGTSYRRLVEYSISADQGAGDDAGYAQTTDQFEAMGMQLVSHTKPLIKTGAEIEVILSAPQDVSLFVTLEKNGKTLPATLTRWLRRENQLIIQCQFPDPGEYKLSIFAKRGGDSYTNVLTYRVNAAQGLGQSAGFVVINRDFSDLGLELVSPQRPLIVTDSECTIEIKAPTDVVTLLRVSRDGKEVRDNLARARREGDRLFIDAQFPDPGRYKLTIFAKRGSAAGSYNQALTYDVEVKKGAGEMAGYCKTGASFEQYGLKLVSHQGAVIASGTELTITLSAPEDVHFTFNLSQEGKSVGLERIKVDRAGNLVKINISFPSPGDYKLTIFARQGAAGSYNYAAEYQVVVK